MRRSKMIWFIVVILAVATFVVVAGVVSRARDVQSVVVAARSLAVGQRLGSRDVQVQEMAAGAVLPGAFESAEEILGQTVAVPRAPGDQITAATLGEGQNPLVATLPPDWRAVGVTVNDAQGLVGLLKPGDTVGVIAYVEPRQAAIHTTGANANPTYEIEDSPQARLSLSGLWVLFVPQEFRYVENASAGDMDDNISAGTSSGLLSTQRRERTGVVVLAAPATPITVTVPVSLTGVTTETFTVTPVELLALLDDSGDASVHLVLEPDDAEPAVALGVAINDLLMIRRGEE